MQTYLIGVDTIPESVGGVAFFENVREGTSPVYAYEAISYRGGDVFIDHEMTRTADGREYPVYEVLTVAQFTQKYGAPKEPLPVVTMKYGTKMTPAAAQNRDSALVDRSDFLSDVAGLTVTMERAVRETWQSQSNAVESVEPAPKAPGRIKRALTTVASIF